MRLFLASWVNTVSLFFLYFKFHFVWANEKLLIETINMHFIVSFLLHLLSFLLFAFFWLIFFFFNRSNLSITHLWYLFISTTKNSNFLLMYINFIIINIDKLRFVCDSFFCLFHLLFYSFFDSIINIFVHLNGRAYICMHIDIINKYIYIIYVCVCVS